MKNMPNNFVFIFILLSIALLSSCISPKSVTYVNNLSHDSIVHLDSLPLPQPLIAVNDGIDIRVGGENEKTVTYLNQYFGNGAGAAVATTNGTTGGSQYIVDVDGNIILPKLGKIKLAGLTREQARDTLTALYTQLLIDPIVSVKFSGFRFSVIGGVTAPGTFTVASEKINIFEALAQAGDITTYGRFDKVRILRETNGKREIITVNLTDKSILNSDNFYIRRYDFIYVESRNIKYVTDNLTRTVTFLGALVSLLAIILVLK